MNKMLSIVEMMLPSRRQQMTQIVKNYVSTMLNVTFGVLTELIKFQCVGWNLPILDVDLDHLHICNGFQDQNFAVSLNHHILLRPLAFDIDPKAIQDMA